ALSQKIDSVLHQSDDVKFKTLSDFDTQLFNLREKISNLDHIDVRAELIPATSYDGYNRHSETLARILSGSAAIVNRKSGSSWPLQRRPASLPSSAYGTRSASPSSIDPYEHGGWGEGSKPLGSNTAGPTSTTIVKDKAIDVRKDNNLLPHDGLFIRRNNQFGTKLVTGIAPMIERGVIIDQNVIRFDDFVASSRTGLPSPISGKTITVSHGVTEIPLQAKRDSRATHYVEILIQASEKITDNM